MTTLIDLVNFNADASCLNSGEWLSSLQGQRDSKFCQWLSLYVLQRKRMVLGLTGATISDLVIHNPEAVEIVRDHPDIFEIILRPYAHDIALFRTPFGFRFNLAAGIAAIVDTFGRYSSYYLPPEFMLMSDQVAMLATNVRGTFINPQRYGNAFAERLPPRPYYVRGVMASRLGCIPVRGELTQVYLRTIQLWDDEEWSRSTERENTTLFIWRDGESSFLLPDGLAREEHWLKSCTAERSHLGGENYDEGLEDGWYKSYPVHSCSAWLKEFRMLGYLNRLNEIERRLPQLGPEAQYWWLLAINSDILSAFEKHSPVVQLRAARNEESRAFEILRSERGFEGEDYLARLEQELNGGRDYSSSEPITQPHLLKAHGRLEHLRRLQPTCNTSTRYS